MEIQHSAGRGIVLNITQEIIDQAVPRDSGHCILADALKAAVPHARGVSVDLQTMRWTDPRSKRRYIYLTPAAAQATLANFDLGVTPEPGIVRLGRPAQIVVTQNRQKKAASETPKPRKPRQVAVPTNGGQPTVLGGKLPPTSALATVRGRRRTFGLKSLTTVQQ